MSDRKADLTRLPPRALAAAARVMEFDGDSKHEAGDWLEDGKGSRRHVAGALRHILDFIQGQDQDEGSGEHVLANATTRLLMALELEVRGQGKKWRVYGGANPKPNRLDTPRPVSTSCRSCGKTHTDLFYALDYAGWTISYADGVRCGDCVNL